jgi:hypothetical protein
VIWPVTIVTADAEIEGEVRNVSPAGAFIACEDIPPLQGSFRLLMKPPKRKTMTITAKVIWSTVITPSEGVPHLGVGVQFTQISEDDSQFLYGVIAKLCPRWENSSL